MASLYDDIDLAGLDLSLVDYRKAVEKVHRVVDADKPKPMATQPLDAYDVTDLCQDLLSSGVFAKPSRPSQPRKARGASLPRKYPKMWMAQPHSNSLMFEFKAMQAKPSNNLKQWRD